MSTEDSRIIRIENKVDEIKDTIGKINVTLASQHESLKIHIRRTELLENELKRHENDDTKRFEVLERQVIAHSASSRTLLRVALVLLGIPGVIATILALIKHAK